MKKKNIQTGKILKIWWCLENGKFEKKFEEKMKKKIWIRKFKKRKFEKGSLKKEIWKRIIWQRKSEKGKFEKDNKIKWNLDEN